MKLPVTKHCPNCGSDDITALGVEMRWDARSQLPRVAHHGGGWICEACDAAFAAPERRTIIPGPEAIEAVRRRIAQIERAIVSAASMGRHHDARFYESHIAPDREWLAAAEAATASLPIAAE